MSSLCWLCESLDLSIYFAENDFCYYYFVTIVILLLLLFCCYFVVRLGGLFKWLSIWTSSTTTPSVDGMGRSWFFHLLKMCKYVEQWICCRPLWIMMCGIDVCRYHDYSWWMIYMIVMVQWWRYRSFSSFLSFASLRNFHCRSLVFENQPMSTKYKYNYLRGQKTTMISEGRESSHVLQFLIIRS